MNYYLAHPLDERKNIREWELEFENRTKIELINPFYDTERKDVERIDAGRVERYEKLNPTEIVERDLREIDESDGTIAFITGALSYGTIMEIFYTKKINKPCYIIITNGHENHPWLKYCSKKIFTNKEDFEKWITNEEK
jgi:nucleoside 2-deoxyribosyltransferase